MANRGHLVRERLAPGIVVATLILVAPLAAMASWRSDRTASIGQLRTGPGLANHPVGVIPSTSIRIPEGWPLDPGGAITCLTCHESVESLLGGGTGRLREAPNGTANTGSFCVNCHGVDRPASGSGSHWMAIPQAHIKADADGTASSIGRLDANSAQCLSCHDGVSAPETHLGSMGAAGGASFSDKGRNHPVGVSFAGNRSRRGMKLRPVSALPTTIRLPGGQVSCVSCHNLYNPTPKRLSVPIEGSALCLSCHDMD